MLFNRALALTLILLSNSADAFNVGKKEQMPAAASKNVASVMTAGVISAATLLPLGPAVAADVVGTPLESKLANFGAASYPVFNAITDVSPLADTFIEFVDKTVKPEASTAVAQKAVDGLLAIPDSSISEYRGVLKNVVYSGVSKDNCVTLGGSGEAAKKLAASAAVKGVDSGKIDALKKKFAPANSAVPLKDGNICLPGSAAASERLWVAQAELTLSMPKTEGAALVSAIKTAGGQATRPNIAKLVPAAEAAFSKNSDAVKMVAAGKDVEPSVIAAVKTAIQ